MNKRPGTTPTQTRAVKTRAKLLSAAVKVIERHGASGLTLDKVAAEANVSKGGLLYHFSSKDELVSALLDRTLSSAGANLEERMDRIDRGGGERGAFAVAYLEYTRQPYTPSVDDDIASSILAAAALDKRLLAETEQRFERWQERLLADGLSDALALLVRIVSDGLWLIDTFRLAPLTEDQRGRVIDLLETLIEDEIESQPDD